MKSNYSFPIPLTLAELHQHGVNPRLRCTDYWRVHRGLYLPNTELPPGGPRDLHVLTRAAVLQKARPSIAIGGVPALMIHGVPHLPTAAPVTAYSRSHRHLRDHRLNVVWRCWFDEVSTEMGYLNDLAFTVVDPARATIDCLIAIRAGQLRLWAPHIHSVDRTEGQMVQLIDAVRTHLGISQPDLRVAAQRLLARDTIERILDLSDSGAHSPSETILRLIVSDMTHWQTQLQFYWPNGRLLTAADLACKKSKVALFYDGEHHLDRSQRDYDTAVVHELERQGWKAVRITSGQLRNPAALRRTVAEYLK